MFWMISSIVFTQNMSIKLLATIFSWVREQSEPLCIYYGVKNTISGNILQHLINSAIPWSPEVFNSPRQILTLLNKVPGYWLQGETDLANKPRILQIFPHSKFGINRTAGLKVMAKKFLGRNLNFLAITFMPTVRLIPNFKCGKICKILGLFARSVSPWSQ